MTSTNYKATSNAEALQIDKTAVNNSQPVKYALAIGAKTSEGIKADIYSNTFTLASVANPVYHSVGFVDWTENMPDAIAGTGTSITLPTTTPTKPGYTFAGWCKVKPTNNGTTCSAPATLNETTGKYDLTTTDGVAYTNLYATWEMDIVCTIEHIMQKVSEWAHCLDSNGLPVTAIDARDNNTYQVAKMPDGKIWMLDNLDLGDTTAMILTPDDTNIASDFELPAATNAGFTSYSQPIINIESRARTGKNTTGGEATTDRLEEASAWRFGVYYNYCAASAGSVCDDENTQPSDAPYDICPKGWRLPTGGANGEYSELSTSLTGTSGDISDSAKVAVFRKKFHLALAGYLNGASPRYQGSLCDLWSGSASEYTSVMHAFSVSGVSAFPQSTFPRWAGSSVRCMAK